jgi:putative ABC transport system ATP-binding protein
LVTGIVEIRNERLYNYCGNYDAFLDERDAQQEQQLAAFKNQQREIGRLMDFVNRFRAKNTTATRAQAKLKQIDRMEKINAPEQAASTVDFAFPQPEKSGQRVITLKGINFAYGQNVIYTGLEFEAQRGDRTVLVGPNGSGKSTLMHCVAGLDSLTTGNVFISDTDLSSLNDKQLTELRRKKVGFIFQAFNLIPTLSAEENIMLPLTLGRSKGDRTWIDGVIDTISLRDRLKHRPSELSGGQQQRVAIARALASQPDIIFADEPTGNLDSKTGSEVLTFMRRAVSDLGQTIVMVTHDAVAASYADRIVFLADGKIAGEMFSPPAQKVLDYLKHLGE